MKASKFLKVTLCLFLICSLPVIEARQATELEKEVFKELSQYGKVVMDSINPEEFKSAMSSNLALRENYVDPFLVAFLIVEAVCLLYKGIVALFGYRVSQRFTDIPMDKGYDQLTQKVGITYMAGSRPGENCKNIPRIISSLAKLAKLQEGTPNYLAFTRAFEHAKYADTKVWGKKTFVFSNPTVPGRADYISVMITKYDDEDYVPGPDTGEDEPLCTNHEKYYTLFLYMDAVMKLNGDVRIVTTEEHWGVWRERTKSEITYLPRGEEPQDVLQLFRFFDLVGLKALKEKYNVEAPEVQIAVQGQ